MANGMGLSADAMVWLYDSRVDDCRREEALWMRLAFLEAVSAFRWRAARRPASSKESHSIKANDRHSRPMGGTKLVMIDFNDDGVLLRFTQLRCPVPLIID